MISKSITDEIDASESLQISFTSTSVARLSVALIYLPFGALHSQRLKYSAQLERERYCFLVIRYAWAGCRILVIVMEKKVAEIIKRSQKLKRLKLTQVFKIGVYFMER